MKGVKRTHTQTHKHTNTHTHTHTHTHTQTHQMKPGDETPVFKKENQRKKDNITPITILPNLSKVFERP